MSSIAGKGYHRAPNRSFLATIEFKDGIMRKDEKNAKLTELEINKNKKISKVRYIVEQYFGLNHLHDDGQRAKFTTIDKNHIDIWFRQVAFNIQRGFNILKNRRPQQRFVLLIKKDCRWLKLGQNL